MARNLFFDGGLYVGMIIIREKKYSCVNMSSVKYDTFSRVATILEIREIREKSRKMTMGQNDEGKIREFEKKRVKSGNLNRLSEWKSFTIP